MPTPTPYDPKIQSLKQRLQKHGGRQGAPGAYGRLQNQRGKRQNYRQQMSTPPAPWHAQSQQEIASAQNQYGQTTAGLAGQRLSTEQQYGFGSDTSNPYSIARQLERNRQQQFQRTGNQYARSGQLYAGSLSRARGYDEFAAGQSLDEQTRAYQARLGEIAQREQQAAFDRDAATNAARAQELDYSLSQPVEPATVGGGGKKKKNKRKRNR